MFISITCHMEIAIKEWGSIPFITICMIKYQKFAQLMASELRRFLPLRFLQQTKSHNATMSPATHHNHCIILKSLQDRQELKVFNITYCRK